MAANTFWEKIKKNRSADLNFLFPSQPGILIGVQILEKICSQNSYLIVFNIIGKFWELLFYVATLFATKNLSTDLKTHK